MKSENRENLALITAIMWRVILLMAILSLPIVGLHFIFQGITHGCS